MNGRCSRAIMPVLLKRNPGASKRLDERRSLRVHSVQHGEVTERKRPLAVMVYVLAEMPERLGGFIPTVEPEPVAAPTH